MQFKEQPKSREATKNKNVNLLLIKYHSAKQFEQVFENEIPIKTLVSLISVMQLINQVVGALLFLHSQQPKIIHGCINPNNILFLLESNTYKAVISIPNAEEIQYMNSVQNFIAPEVFDSSSASDDRCDTYSLGKVILFWFKNFVNESEIQSEVYQSLLKIVNRMCSVDKNRRPKLEQVQQFLRGSVASEQVEDDVRK